MSNSNSEADVSLDDKAERTHRLDNLDIFLYTFLLILTSITIWMFKHRRVRFIHETGLAVIYGLIVGCIIHYASEDAKVTKLVVQPVGGKYNDPNPPDVLWLHLPKRRAGPKAQLLNKTYTYMFRGEVADGETNAIEWKATFDSEVFFNILLPPIIFHAGYSLKRKYFFRNLGAIFTYAFIGTTLSAFTIGGIIYMLAYLVDHLKAMLSFQECLFFGALISATDPVTILAIFHDLHVDVILYALVFGESVLNDAVAIVMTGAVEHYGEQVAESGESFQPNAFLQAIGHFVWIFAMSFLIGSVMGCLTAIITKFSHIKDFPILETCIFVLMSYSTFLISEAAQLTGIVAVLFCGICQAHYTYNNLSQESRIRTKQFFELLNLLAENFIFSYIGVSMFTFPKHHWDYKFILISFLAVAVGRFVNIYPLSFLLNLGRKSKIPYKFQHMLFFAGLRGAIAFALAIRNTLHESRQMILSTTSLIVAVTVIVCGGSTTQLLSVLDIPVGVDDDREMAQLHSSPSSVYNTMRRPDEDIATDKAMLARLWGSFDVRYMKPFLTHSHPTLMDTLPKCCMPLARCLTSTRQLARDSAMPRPDSDTGLCIDESELSYGERTRESSLQSLQRHDQLATITIDNHSPQQAKTFHE